MKKLLTIVFTFFYYFSEGQNVNVAHDFSNNGIYLVNSEDIYINKKILSNLFFYNVKEKKCIDSIKYVKNGRFSSNSKYFAFIDSSNKIKIYNLKDRSITTIYNNSFNSECIYSKTPEYIMFFNNRKSLYISLNSTPGEEEFACINNFNWNSNNKLVFVEKRYTPSSSCHSVRYFNLYKQKQYNLSISKDYKSALIRESNFCDNNSRTLKIKDFLPKYNLPDSIFWACTKYMAISPDGNYLFVTYDNSGKIGYIIDTKTLKIISKIESKEIIVSYIIRDAGILFTDKNRKIITANTKNEICLWDLKSGKFLKKLQLSKLFKNMIDPRIISFYPANDYLIIQFEHRESENHFVNKKQLVINTKSLELVCRLNGNESFYSYFVDEFPYHIKSVGGLSNYVVTINVEKKYNTKYNTDFFVSVYNAKTMSFVKKLKQGDFNIFDESNFEIKINKTFLFFSHYRVFECDLSIVDFLKTLNLPNK